MKICMIFSPSLLPGRRLRPFINGVDAPVNKLTSFRVDYSIDPSPPPLRGAGSRGRFVDDRNPLASFTAGISLRKMAAANPRDAASIRWSTEISYLVYGSGSGP